jgi:hypothetical protein
MKTNKTNAVGDVFSTPVRKLSADELSKVVGGGPFSEVAHYKCNAGTDNQGGAHS